MNKEELSNAISDYQKSSQGTYNAILNEIEKKQSELNFINKSIEFAKKTSATPEEINNLLEQAQELQTEIDKLTRNKYKMANKFSDVKSLLSNAAIAKIKRSSPEEIEHDKKIK